MREREKERKEGTKRVKRVGKYEEGEIKRQKRVWGCAFK
jgi:hypothetical protein